MKKIIIGIIVLAFASCNVPKEGEEEKMPTSKLEVLTGLGDEDSTKTADSTSHH